MPLNKHFTIDYLMVVIVVNVHKPIFSCILWVKSLKDGDDSGFKMQKTKKITGLIRDRGYYWQCFFYKSYLVVIGGSNYLF